MNDKLTPREHVEQMLKNYQDNVRILEANNQYFENFIPVTHEEVIEQMNFAKPDQDRIQTDVNTERLANIAGGYRVATMLLNKEAMLTVQQEYQKSWQEKMFVEYAITRLPERESRIMRASYIDNISWTSICLDYHISGATLTRIRKRAIDRMVETYNMRYSLFEIDLRRF